jgi:membrane protease YdiL (CAAX protease family)
MNINFKLEKKVLFIHTGIGCLLVSVFPFITEIVRVLLKKTKPKLDNYFLYLLIAVSIGPIIEELLFRKRLLEYLAKINKKNWFLFLSPLAFTITHPLIKDDFIYSLINYFNFYFYSFLFLSLPYYLTKHLEIAIINHILYNLNVIIVSFLNEEVIIEKFRTILFIFFILFIIYLFSLRFVIMLHKDQSESR